MGILDFATDVTGNMTPTELNATNISNIVDELNRNSDQLDSLSQNLNVIASNQLSVTWNGTGGVAPTLATDTISTSVGSSFLGFYSRSDIANQLFSVPNIHYDNSGNILCIVTGQTFTSGTSSIEFSIYFANNGAPVNFVFYYYILQQPASITS